MCSTDRHNLGWRLAPWVLWPLTVFEQAAAWKRQAAAWKELFARLRELRALGILALGLLVAGCVDEAEETLPSGPPLCACDPSFEVALEIVDDGAPERAGHLEPRGASPREPGGTSAVERRR